MWAYPLPAGTHVIAKVHNPVRNVNVQVVGTVVRVVSRTAGRTGCTYAVKTTDGRLIQTWSRYTIPLDTSTEEGADIWMDAIEQSLREGDARHDGLPEAGELRQISYPPAHQHLMMPTTTTTTWLTTNTTTLT
jgi:hypothetical protein